MRQRSGRSSGHVQDLTEQVTTIIRELEASKTPCTRPTLIKTLSNRCSISTDKAENGVDFAIRQGRIIELYPITQSSDPVCHDVLRLKIRRPLRLNVNYDLSSIVRNVLLERGSRSSQNARSVADIHDHIMTTYNLQENSVEYLSSCLDKAIKLLLKKNQIETKVPLNENETHYFLTFISPTISASNNSSTTSLNNKPSTSGIKDENTSTLSPSLSSPNHKLKKREKRLSEVSQQTVDSTGNTEIKSLQDSLSAFFTPSNVRRSRVAQSSFSLENLNDHKVRSPLEIVITNNSDPTHHNKKLSRQHSTEIHSISSSKHSTPSPNSRHTADKDKLFDSLSPYFSATNERRRRHEKGEYLQLCNGGMPSNKKARKNSMQSTDTNSLLASIERRHTDFFDDECSDIDSEEEDETINTESNYLSTIHKKVDSINLPEQNESLAELEVARASSPSTSNKRNRSSTRISESVKKSTTQTRSSNRRSERGNNLKSVKSQNPLSRVSNNLLKRAKHARLVAVNNKTAILNRRASSVLPMTPKKSRAAELPVSSTIVNNSMKANPLLITSPIRRASFSPVKSLNLSNMSGHGDETPVKIQKADEALYQKTRMIVQKRLDENTRLMYEKGEEGIFPAKIRIGKFEINTWYSSPYPQEYACLPMLYICERCLLYMCNDVSHHQEKCKLKYPPGNEIYRSDNLSVFEIDGNLARVYCRNLCLLAKLFMDHKTLYFDVEPFLFYVLTVNDENGCHFVGYFSKEKYSHQQFNLACIVTLPCYQKRGYGRFLIDFSYLLSRREKMLGTPERPLSEMGKIAYESYWRTAIFEYLHQRHRISELETLSAMEISKATGIVVHDVVDILKAVGFLSPSNGEAIAKNQNLIWTVDWSMVDKHFSVAKKSDRRVWLDEAKLKWSPKVYTPNTDFFLRSPLRSPVFSPTGSPRKIHNFSSNLRRTDHTSQKASTSQLPTSAEQKSLKKVQKNSIAAVLTKNVKDSGSESDDEPSDSKLAQDRKIRMDKRRQSTVANQKDEFSSSDSDTPNNRAQSSRSQVASITAASKTKTRKTQNSYMSCPSNSEKDEDEKIFGHNKVPVKANPDQSSSVFRFSGTGVGRKKLPAEVELAEKRSEQQKVKKEQLISKKVSRRSQSLSSIESSDDDFGKRNNSRRPLSAKKRITQKQGSSCKPTRTITPTANESTSSKNNARSRAGAKKPTSSKRGVPKKKSPSKQQKRSPSKSPELTTKIYDEDSVLNHSDEDDEPYRSSASPPPLSKRQHRHSILHRTSLNQIVETMNLGGEPEFVNMGGTPEDDSQPAYAHSQTPKAPKPPPNLEEDEENESSIARVSLLPNETHQIANFVIPSTNSMEFNAQPLEHNDQPHWPIHKQPIEVGNYPLNYGNPQPTFNGNNPIFQQQSTIDFPNLTTNTNEIPIPSMNAQTSTHVNFIINSPSDQNTEMPVLKPGVDEELADEEMPRLVEDDDAPPELSPMTNMSESNNLENDEPDSFEPPKLEDSTAPIPISQTTVQIPSIQTSISTTIPKATSFDSFVDQKTLSLRKQSMPASMLCTSTSADERFENESFVNGTALPNLQIKKHQSPPTIHHTAYNSNSHPPQSQMFSPQAVAAVHTPNSLQPQSHASNSTASESGINVLDIMSPANLQKASIDHLPPPYNNIAIPQQPQVYSPPKLSSKRKEKQQRPSGAASRRRNTTDGVNHKTLEHSQIDPKFAQQASANNAANCINGMFFSNPHLMGSYLMPNSLPTANNQFGAIAQPPASANPYYDYAGTQPPYPFYNTNFYPPYQGAGGEMLNPMGPNVGPFAALYQFQQNQQQQIQPIIQPQLPTFGQISNTALANNPASLMNNGAASIYYNGFN